MIRRLPFLLLGGALLLPSATRAQDTLETEDTASVQLAAPPPARQAQDTLATGELEALFSRIEQLRDVTVAVDGGVATLTGRTLTQEARVTAGELAATRPEVVYVENRIEVESSLLARSAAVLVELRASAVEWLARAPVLVAALLIVVVFGLLARALSALPWLPTAFGATPFAADLTRRITRIVIWLVGIMLALQLLDATALVGALLGAAGVAGLAFGFAFRNIAENWLAGILLSVRRPFELDDEVSIDGHEGRIVRLTHSDTVLMTMAGNHLRIPNASVYNGRVENFTRNPLRMVRLRLTMPRDTFLERARAALLESLREAPVLGDPEPRVVLTEVGDSHLVIELRAWVDQRAAGFARTRSLVYELAKDALRRADITGPISEHTLHMAADEAGDSPAEPKGSAPEHARAAVSTELGDLGPEDELAPQVAADRERSSDVNLLD